LGEIRPGAKATRVFSFWSIVQMSDETARLRRALAAQLVAVVAADFERKGAEAVERLREKDPSAYLRTVTGVTADAQPSETTGNKISDEQLKAAMAFFGDAIRAREGADRGTGTPPECEQTGELPPVPEADAVS
jgi:hypothetical protein